MDKIAIVGVPGSGKTTLANTLGEMLSIPVYHLDKIAWKKGGVFASQSEIIEKVEEILKKPRWIIDGSMPRSKTLEMRIADADTIVFFDIPLLVILWRQTKRFFKHFNKVRPDMGGDNIQRHPFTWKDLKHVLSYPTVMIYEKLEPYKTSKNVIVIRGSRDEVSFLKGIESSLKRNHGTR